VNRGGFRPSIAHADLDQQVLRSALGVLDEYIEVAIAREDVDGGKTAW